MQLTEHFSLEELINSETASRRGIDNTPDAVVKNNLTILASNLEVLRKLLGKALIISSGYRCPKLNTVIGGARDSAHMTGYAADFICPSFGTPDQIAKAIKASNIELDQCIMEGTWVHVSYAPTKRNQYLKATFINGKARYELY